MKTVKKILAFSREAGGARAVAPVCHAMIKEGWNVLLLAKDHSLNIFRDQGLECTDFPNFDPDNLLKLVNKRFGSFPDIVVTSATSLPTIDMTEKYLWRWGNTNCIPTVGILDQWQNYALRFSGPGDKERLAYLPDHVFVMDDIAKMDMIKDGIPEERIIITGQPAFSGIVDEHKACLLRTGEIKKRFEIPDGFTVVTFAAESLKKNFGGELGYDEQSTLRFVGDALKGICRATEDLKIYLIIKLHPENVYEEFEWAVQEWPSIGKRIIGKELSPRETIAISDVMIGMTSIMLIEAILADKPTISLQINSSRPSQLVVTKTGAIPFITTRDAASAILNRLLTSEEARKEYLKRQKTWKISKDATGRCMDALKIRIYK